MTIDFPQTKYKESVLILYALPNGNTTEQTMGKKSSRVMTGTLIFNTSKPKLPF